MAPGLEMDLESAASVAKSVSTVVTRSYARLQGAHEGQKAFLTTTDEKELTALANPKLLTEVNDVLSSTVVPALPPTPTGNDGLSLQAVMEEGQDLANDLAGVCEKSIEEVNASPFKKVLNKTLGRDEVSQELKALQPKVEAFRDKTERLLSESFGLEYDPSDMGLSAEDNNIDATTKKINAEVNNINTHGLRLAVEQGQAKMVSQLIKRDADAKEANIEGKTPLHIAAKKGRGDLVDLLGPVSDGLNIQDMDGRTPLYYAVASGRWDTVSTLLPKGTRSLNVNVVDRFGCSILSLVLGDPARQKIAYRLIECGASPANGVDPNVLRLIMAATRGDKEAIMSELKVGVDVNGQDGFGYNALYEAARYGHCDVVELLIAAGAKPNAQTGIGGDTALHGIVDKGRRCRAFLQPFDEEFKTRTRTPCLGSEHVEVVELLLRHGAQPDIKRWDGLTVNTLISRLLAGKPTGDDQILTQETSRSCPRPTFTLEEGVIIKRLEDLIGSPPPVRRKSLPGGWRPTPQKLNEGREKVCQYFKARVEYHKKDILKYRDFSVDGLIYNPQTGEEAAIAQLEGWAFPGYRESNGECWKWIHLPANNKRWVKDLIRKIYSNSNSSATNAWALEAFIDDSYQEFRGSASYARYRRPAIVKQCEDKNVFSIVVPYFDMETEEFLTRQQRKDNDHFFMKQQLEDNYRHGGPDAESLHLPCTLDQSYYMSLTDSSERDKDQVVYRFYERGRGSAASAGTAAGTLTQDETAFVKGRRSIDGKKPEATTYQPCLSVGKQPLKILMVNQLWLWKLDESTIITAFPDRWSTGQEAEILRHITGRIWESPPASMNQMILNILQQCVGFVDAPSNAGLDDNLFDIFEQSIANVADNETNRYKTFRKQQRRCAEFNTRIRKKEELTDAEKETLIKAEDKIADISSEIKFLEEIKDIRDELRMIQRVLDDQYVVFKKFCDDKGMHQHRDDCEFNELAAVEFRREKSRRLDKQAEGVETSLKALLDLKQKQGNWNEARDTRVLAWEAEQRARAGEVQSQILFIFTGATVFYTPLAFVFTFFAVPGSDSPRSSGSNGSWRWWQIFVGSTVAEVATLLAVAAYLYWISTADKGRGMQHSPGKRLKRQTDNSEDSKDAVILAKEGSANYDVKTPGQDHASDANLVEGQRTPGHLV